MREFVLVATVLMLVTACAAVDGKEAVQAELSNKDRAWARSKV